MNKSPVDSYYYLNVIIKSEQIHLLSKAELINLANSLDLPTFRQRLMRYYPDIKIYPDLDSIHGFLRDNQIQSNWKIIKNSPNSIYKFLIAYFLLEFEAENIKTIIKSKSLDISYEFISRDIHLSVERIVNHEELLNKFIYLDNISAGFELFKNTIYYDGLKKADIYYKKIESLAYFDIFIDYSLVKNIKKEFNELNKNDQRLIEDQINIFFEYYCLKTLIRGLTFGFDKNFIKEVLINENELIDKLLKLERLDDIIEYFYNKSRYSKALKKSYKKTIEDVLTFFRDYYHQYSLKLLGEWKASEDYNILLPFSFLLMKRFQIEDVKLISIGTVYQLEPKEILEKTILCHNNK